MTVQEAFTKIKTHLLIQNARAQTKYGTCRLYTPDGLKCAVGCLIPLEEYDVDYENQHVSTYYKKVSTLKSLPLEFLVEMQSLHDNVPPAEWKDALAQYENRNKTFLVT